MKLLPHTTSLPKTKPYPHIFTPYFNNLTAPYFGHRESLKETFAEEELSPPESLELATIVWRINIDEVPSRLKLFYICAKNLFTDDMNIFQRRVILENLLLATPQKMKDRLDALVECKSTLLPTTLDAIERCEVIVQALRYFPEQIRQWATQTKSEKPSCVVQ